MRSTLIVMLCALVITPCVAEQVVLVNPGFEEDTDGDLVPDGWRPWIHGDNFEITISDEQAFEGRRSVRITGLAGHGDRACVGQTTQPHELAKAYRLSFAVRGEGRATGIFRLRYNPPDGPAGEITFQFAIGDVTPDAWVQKSYEFGVPEEVRAVGQARIELLLYQRGEGDLYYDAVSIEKLTEWTPPQGTAQPAPPAITTTTPLPEVTLRNPGFEVDENADGMPDAWSFHPHGEGWEAAISDLAHSGEHSLRITGGPDHGDRAAVLQVSEPAVVAPGYRLRFFVRGAGPAGKGIFRFRYVVDGEEQDDTRYFDIATSTDQWTENVHDFLPSAEVREIGVARIEIILYQRGEGDIYYDDVTIEPLEAPTVGLINPGFEADENSDGIPDGWRTFASGEGFEFTLSDIAHSGVCSAAITGLPGHADRACWGQTTDMIPMARAYRLRVWARGSGRATGIFRYRYIDAAGQPAEDTRYFSFDNLSADEWRENTFEFATSDEVLAAGEGQIELLLYQRGEGQVLFDDVSIEALEEFTPHMNEDQEATQTPRRPADGRVVLQNPPDFWWPPQLNADSYELQLATSADFTDPITITDLPYNCYSHSATLDPSKRWYWRFRFKDGDAVSEWSQTWHFNIAPDAVAFPVPPPDELLARVPEDHPRIYATRATLESFRARRLGEMAWWWESFQERCETHMKTDLPTEPGPEYDFSSRTGPLSAEDKARMDELRGLGSRATGPMWELAFGYLISGEERYGRRAIDWLMEISSWDPEGTTGYRNHDQVFRDIAWKSACVYDWCWDLMTTEQRAAALDAIIARGAILYRDFREDSHPIYEWPFDSHGWTSMGFLGIIAIATCHDIPQADEWFRFVTATYPSLYPPWGGEEGGWCQGTAYWKWSVSYFGQFAEALRSATGLDLLDKAFSRNNGWFKLVMHPPFCDRHHFGDGNLGAPGITDRNNLLYYATRYHNPYFKWYADQIPGDRDSGVFGYWWYDYNLPSRPPVDVPQSRYLADIGWVGMHSDMSDPEDVMLIFKSSWYGSFNHSHADQNHFVIYGYGEPLLIDSGYYDWYGSDHDLHWTRQTKAHNDILINGEGQPIFDIRAKGQIIDYFESPTGCYTAGDATQAYRGRLSRFVRHILYLRPDAFLIVDELATEEPSTFTWCCHALQQMTIDEAARRVTVQQHEAFLDIAFAAPSELSFTQDDDWDGHPPQGRYARQPRQWHLYAETTEPAATQRFVTLMRVRKGGEAPEFVPAALDGAGIGARLGALRAAVRTEAETPLTVDDYTIDADFAAAYEFDGGVSILAVGARAVSAASAPAPLFTSTESVTVTLQYDDSGLRRVDLQAQNRIRVALWSPGGREGLTVDGEPADTTRCDWDPGRAVLTLDLEPGKHEIAAAPAQSAQATSLAVTINGEPADCDQEQIPCYTGGTLLVGTLRADPGLYAVDERTAAIILNGAPVDARAGLVWLNSSNPIEVRVAEPTDAKLALRRIGLTGEPHQARVLDELPPSAAIIEAETFVEHGLGSPTRYSHRTFLSGGVGVGEWIIPGMWLRWQIEPPTPGRYYLVLKGATHEPHADRVILLDGEPLGGKWQTFRFNYTGGYGAKPEEWAHLLVTGDGGEPIVLELAEGPHDLRMICLEGRLNLDYLALIPAE